MLLLLLSCTAISPCRSTQVLGRVETNRDVPLANAEIGHCDVGEPTECSGPVRIGSTDASGSFDVEVPGSARGLRGCVFTNMVITHPDCAPMMGSVPLLFADEAIQLDCRS